MPPSDSTRRWVPFVGVVVVVVVCCRSHVSPLPKVDSFQSFVVGVDDTLVHLHKWVPFACFFVACWSHVRSLACMGLFLFSVVGFSLALCREWVPLG